MITDLCKETADELGIDEKLVYRVISNHAKSVADQVRKSEYITITWANLISFKLDYFYIRGTIYKLIQRIRRYKKLGKPYSRLIDNLSDTWRIKQIYIKKKQWIDQLRSKQ